MTKKAKRGYSREFSTTRTERRVRVEIDRIPATLHAKVLAKSTRDGVSLRTLTLRLWQAWLEGRVTTAQTAALETVVGEPLDERRTKGRTA